MWNKKGLWLCACARLKEQTCACRGILCLDMRCGGNGKVLEARPLTWMPLLCCKACFHFTPRERTMGNLWTVWPSQREVCEQFARRRGAAGEAECEIKFFLSQDKFDREVEMHHNPALSAMMVPIEDKCIGIVCASSGYAFPSFLVMERGLVRYPLLQCRIDLSLIASNAA
jgi:hypothetical protein